jgi:DNA modification methylase
VIEWTTEQRKLKDLAEWPKNPRQLSQHDAEHIQRSIDKFGLADPLVVNADGRIIGGHQRKRIMLLMDEYGEDAVIDVRIPSRQLTESEAEELAIRLNRNSGNWDWDILANEFDVDALLDYGFSEYDFELAGIELPTDEPPDDPGPQIDRAAELQEKWGTKLGQVWELGDHRLVCGDCTDEMVVDAVLQGDIPALMVTDPPYGVNYDPEWRNKAAEAGFLSFAPQRTRTVSNDDRFDWSDAYLLFPGDVAYTWSPPGDHVILTGLALQKADFQIRNQIIWVKPHFPISRGHYTYQHEPCWYGVKKGRKSYWIGDNNASTKWEIALDKNIEGGHSTQKPLECMARPIRNHQGDVYDPFVGSGTTVIACERLSRRCYAIDIDPAYFQRWHDLTGKEPKLLEG